MRAGGGQDRGGRAAAGAAADDDEVDLDRRQIGDLGAGEDAAGGRSWRSGGRLRAPRGGPG